MRMPLHRSGMQQRCSSSALSTGQRFLLGCYILLFALVLPFICWGALAEPGHPHRAPHFVFAEPLLAKGPADHETVATLPALPALTTHRQHLGADAATVTQPSTNALCYQSTTTPVGGRATPTLLLFIILLLLIDAGLSFQRPARLDFVRWLRLSTFGEFFSPVPLPPPRLPLFHSFSV